MVMPPYYTSQTYEKAAAILAGFSHTIEDLAAKGTPEDFLTARMLGTRTI